MCDNVKSNPFAGLFSSVNDAVSFSSQRQAIGDESGDDVGYAERSSSGANDEDASHDGATERGRARDAKVEKLMQDVFGITFRLEHARDKVVVFVHTDSIEHAVFERLMLPNPVAKTMCNRYDTTVDNHVIQRQVIPYLYESYRRLRHYSEKTNGDLQDIRETVKDACQVVLRNANTALQEPDLFPSQKV